MTPAALACVTRLRALGHHEDAAYLAASIARGARADVADDLASMMVRLARSYHGEQAARACGEAYDSVRKRYLPIPERVAA